MADSSFYTMKITRGMVRMSKERLMQMEHDYKNSYPINIEWLLEYAKEQAERAQELEIQKENQRDHKMTYRNIAKGQIGMIIRYRKALEFYADKRSWNENVTGKGSDGMRLVYGYTHIQIDEGAKAIKALESGEDE